MRKGGVSCSNEIFESRFFDDNGAELVSTLTTRSSIPGDAHDKHEQFKGSAPSLRSLSRGTDASLGYSTQTGVLDPLCISSIAGLCHGQQVAVHTVVLDVRDLDAIAALPAQLPADFAEVRWALTKHRSRMREAQAVKR